MAKYTVEFRLWANVEVDAESFDEAFTKANKKSQFMHTSCKLIPAKNRSSL